MEEEELFVKLVDSDEEEEEEEEEDGEEEEEDGEGEEEEGSEVEEGLVKGEDPTVNEGLEEDPTVEGALEGDPVVKGKLEEDNAQVNDRGGVTNHVKLNSDNRDNPQAPASQETPSDHPSDHPSDLPQNRNKGWADLPHVTVSYANLSKSSLSLLQDFLRQWSADLAVKNSATPSSLNTATPNSESEDATVSGSCTFFPNAVKTEGTNSREEMKLSWWAELPAQGGTGDSRPSGAPGAVQFKAKDVIQRLASSADVPSYDRAEGTLLGHSDSSKALGSILKGDSESNPAKFLDLSTSNRCFNCGSYVHSLRECPRPKDNSAIAIARTQHAATKNSSGTPGSGAPQRYHGLSREDRRRQAYQGLEPGVLCPELREALGIEELDPPPWLWRMKGIGYPPGYLAYESEDEGSETLGDDVLPMFLEDGVELEGPKPDALETPKGDEKKTVEASPSVKGPKEEEDVEDGEISPSLAKTSPEAIPKPAKLAQLERKEPKETVQFPGVNAPIPTGASASRWANPPSNDRPPYNDRSRERDGRYPRGYQNRFASSSLMQSWPGIFQGWEGWPQGGVAGEGMGYGGGAGYYGAHAISPLPIGAFGRAVREQVEYGDMDITD